MLSVGNGGGFGVAACASANPFVCNGIPLEVAELGRSFPDIGTALLPTCDFTVCEDVDVDGRGGGGGGILGSTSMSIAFSSSSSLAEAASPPLTFKCSFSSSPMLLPATEGLLLSNLPLLSDSSGASVTDACLEAGIDTNLLTPALGLTDLDRFSGEGGACGGNTQLGSLSV